MPRRYYRRRTIVRAPRKKWGSNIYPFGFNTSGTTLQQFNYQVLVKNSASSGNPTPVILKAGNFKVQGDADFTTTAAASRVQLSMYIMYVPEGISPTDYDGFFNMIKSHPEWVLAWKYVSANGVDVTSESSESNSFSFSSRLKRNLNSGDQIMLIALANGVNIDYAHFSGMCQYWTCSN